MASISWSIITNLNDPLQYNAVNGSWVGAEAGKTFDVSNPMDGKVLCAVPDMSSADTLAAVEAASEAFKSWQYTTAKERSNLLRGWYNLCVQNGEELAKLLTAEQGKPLPEARGEISYGNSFLEWFSEEARRINGEVASSPTNTK